MGSAPWQLPGRAGGGAAAGIKPQRFGRFLLRTNEGIKTDSLRIVFARFVFGHSLEADVRLAD